MSKDNIIKLIQPGTVADQLKEALRSGARALLAQAVEAEVEDFLGKHADLKTANGRQRIVRHGHLPEREVMTGIGPVRYPPAACARSRGGRVRSRPHPVLSVDPATLHAAFEADRDAAADPLPEGDLVGRLLGGAGCAARRMPPGCRPAKPAIRRRSCALWLDGNHGRDPDGLPLYR